ncbi:hypothetical protein [Roseovarius dicentrarchi]|uniref:hypothetical protein n=1 Tax=Roseovarius dicentrarchi TaxID=2250573 RepID=UPI000DE9F7A7|nr:hypothetical protein [Roseovarius dicentrarchi]
MAGKFITLILAASVAITGLTAAPARASDRDLALALGALVGVAVIGAAIHDAKKKDRRRAAARQHPRPQYGTQHRSHRAQKQHRSRSYQQGYDDHRRKVQDRRAHRRMHRRDQRPQYGYSARPYRRAD